MLRGAAQAPERPSKFLSNTITPTTRRKTLTMAHKPIPANQHVANKPNATHDAYGIFL